MTDLDLPVIVGTVRRDNHSTGVGRFVHARGAARPGVSTRLYLPSELPLGNLVDREWEMDPKRPEVVAFVEAMGRADGFMIVTPEYNYGLPGTLKNLLDAIYDEWGRKPFAFVGVSSGMVGGARAIDQLRMVAAGVGAVSVPLHGLIRRVQDSFDGDRPVQDVEEYTTRIDKVWADLEWYARALKSARAGGPGPR